MKQRRFLLLGTALAMAGAFALPTLALAQGAYPNRPIKFVVPYSAGGLPDTVARISRSGWGTS